MSELPAAPVVRHPATPRPSANTQPQRLTDMYVRSFRVTECVLLALPSPDNAPCPGVPTAEGGRAQFNASGARAPPSRLSGPRAAAGRDEG
ncbi:hypothetical protein MFU01_14220 [Myxococcus fulvus]|uniref:Uncharacterized protein n=1 Tax=Myxococcus fulvus TaxID=33 RepID=A0A511SWW6_MYXFU|nr:hypothetical protein MFU01_14220 [Myxococcus fulvus]